MGKGKCKQNICFWQHTSAAWLMSSWLPVKPKLKMSPHHTLNLREKKKLTFPLSLFQLLALSFLSWFIIPSPMPYLLVIHSCIPLSCDWTNNLGTLVLSLTFSNDQKCPSLYPGDNVNNMQDWWLVSENIKIAPVSLAFFLFFFNESEIHILKHLKYTYIHRTNPTWLDMWINERVCHILQ